MAISGRDTFVYVFVSVSNVACLLRMLNVACCKFDTFTHIHLSPRLWRATSVLPDTASVRYFYTARDSQLKCVRKLFYTNLSLTFSPNEAWPKVLQGIGKGAGGERAGLVWVSRLIKHALLLLLFMRGPKRALRVIERVFLCGLRAFAARLSSCFSSSLTLCSWTKANIAETDKLKTREI